ncbi:RNA polymerase alpha subunit C-terminal domain-containing protein [Parapedobacter sp. GCM10030251]|uniref:RNA polymerase alpha subunit C-terminal domain-containing protein n=1 Tax=Parapedobacter sp. GCM10030251 TaxID=3273419 RepID=UPI00361D0E5E
MRKMKVCPNGHTYYKSTDCPTCPTCEAERRPSEGFLSLLSAPARRALTNVGITDLRKLSAYSEKEILALHGMGKASMPILRDALSKEGLVFRS